MGIEYAVFNHTTKTWFDLGKGGWYNLSVRDNLLNLASECIEEGQCELRGNPRDWATYLVWICCKVHSFVRTGQVESGPIDTPLGDVEVFGDVGPEQDRFYRLCKSYQKVGDRYIPNVKEVDIRSEVSHWISDDDFELLMSEIPTSTPV